uniref:Uncharacterized protein n=1 Tax=Glossina pallidipes TaxID=7398 RepID=A0A1B0AEM4_GLOPL
MFYAKTVRRSYLIISSRTVLASTAYLTFELFEDFTVVTAAPSAVTWISTTFSLDLNSTIILVAVGCSLNRCRNYITGLTVYAINVLHLLGKVSSFVFVFIEVASEDFFHFQRSLKFELYSL